MYQCKLKVNLESRIPVKLQVPIFCTTKDDNVIIVVYNFIIIVVAPLQRFMLVIVLFLKIDNYNKY